MATAIQSPHPVKIWRLALAVVVPLLIVIALMIATNQLMVGRVIFDSALYLASTLVLAAFYHGLGGFLCARIARGARSAALAIVVLGFLLMAQSVHNTWSTVPPWYSLCMLVIAPGFLWIGARLYRRPTAAGAVTGA